MKIVAAIMALVTALGPKLKDAWPHLEVIFSELEKIYIIMNGGKAPMFGANMKLKTVDGPGLATKIRNSVGDDVDSDTIKKGVAVLELIDGRIS